MDFNKHSESSNMWEWLEMKILLYAECFELFIMCKPVLTFYVQEEARKCSLGARSSSALRERVDRYDNCIDCGHKGFTGWILVMQ